MEESFKLPTLDFCDAKLKPGTLEWDSLRDKVFKALQEYGCFEVLFNKVQPRALHEEMKEIFNFPLEFKMSKSSTMFGYLCQNPALPLYERLTIKDVLSPGVAEKFAKLFWPDGKPTFCDMVLSFSKQLSTLEKTIRRMVMESLGVEKYIEEQNESSNYVLIVNKYRKPTRDESGIGLAPHTDKNILTILFQIQVNGLQMQRENGQWVDVEFSPNSFVVLVGDVFEAWTNGRLHAPIHRVLMSGKDQERFSIGFFTFPKEGYIVKVPEELVDEDHPLLCNPFDGIKYVKFFKSEAGQRAGHDSLKAYCGI
ncbi:hypothetical protein RND71_040557 [Anisodus tanguticus]|uniref:2-oxoglutarate-dependent dioxygenase DAO n=1 Tax=Anisodus tanguticus TaxID=243964 RepID=A0AAE1QSU7_9SOLA|nr:hypothetical protein RND71_040557 [Anisodus tanguticus]